MSNSRLSTLQLAGLSVLGGILMWAGWPPSPVFICLLIGFVPLLVVEDALQKRPMPPTGWQLFGLGFLFFFTWNALTTWWIWNASPGGAIFAILTNSLVMCIPYMLFYRTKRLLGAWPGYMSFIAYWVTFEFLHYKWQLAWPWLNLGNGLAKFPSLVQWYEYTGTLGGTIWLLFINIIIFQFVKHLLQREEGQIKPLILQITKSTVLILFPIFLSLYIYTAYEEKGKTKQITVVQPNVDPYEKEVMGNDSLSRMQNLLKLSERGLSQETDYLVWPEVAIPGSIWLNRMDDNQDIHLIRSFLKDYAGTTLIAGFSGYERYDTNKPPTPTARYFAKDKCCYDAYNSALQISDNKPIEVYHKSKLVPGVEQLPYPWLFGFLTPIASQLGGIMSSLGKQEQREVFFDHNSAGVAPAICYESVFGEYITRYIKNGAEGIVIITNDAWWGKTAGYRQHKSYASLRAIETRRPVIRSANTGISCFIDQRGNVQQETDWQERNVINNEVLFNDGSTFYTRFGDYLGWMGGLIAILFIVAGFVQRRV